MDVGHAGLAHHDYLEAALEGSVFLNVLAVLADRRRSHTAQLAAGERGLDHVRSIQGSLGRPRSHQRVQLIDEQNDFAAGFLDRLEKGLETLLEFAAELRARDQ